MSFRFILLAGAAGAMLSAASPASAAFTINWAALPAGDANPLTVPTSDGNSVTFDSPSGPATFAVGDNSGFYTNLGADFGDFLSFAGDTLTMTFAHPLTQGLMFSFGLEDAFGGFGQDFLTISSNTGVSTIASTLLNGLPFPEPQGTAYIYAPGATVLTITSGNTTNSNPFAIGNVDVPEPLSLSILGVGLAGLAAVRRRRNV